MTYQRAKLPILTDELKEHFKDGAFFENDNWTQEAVDFAAMVAGHIQGFSPNLTVGMTDYPDEKSEKERVQSENISTSDYDWLISEIKAGRLKEITMKEWDRLNIEGKRLYWSWSAGKRRLYAEPVSEVHNEMNEEMARKILGVTVQEDNSLYHRRDYVRWTGDHRVQLDEEFTEDQLRAIAWWMTNMKVRKS